MSTFPVQHALRGVLLDLEEDRYGYPILGETVALEFEIHPGVVSPTETNVGQQSPLALEFAINPGVVAWKTTVVQINPLELSFQILDGAAGSQQSIAQQSSILLEFITPEGLVEVVSTAISQKAPIELELECLLGDVDAGDILISQDTECELEFELALGTITTSTTEVYQTQPVALIFEVFSGSVTNPSQIVGGTAELEFVLNLGTVATAKQIVQTEPILLEFATQFAYITTSETDVIQQQSIELIFSLLQAGVGAVTIIGQILPIELIFTVNEGMIPANIMQTQPVQLEFAISSGVAATSNQVVQLQPVELEFTLYPGTGPTQLPIAVLQTRPVELELYVWMAWQEIGETPPCVWWAPPDCTEDNLADQIIYKQPGEVLWVAYDFLYRLGAGEEIAQILSVTESGGSVITSPVFIETSLPTRLKYAVSGGTDGQNILIKHVVFTSMGRTLEGNGYLYIRQQRY